MSKKYVWLCVVCGCLLCLVCVWGWVVLYCDGVCWFDLVCVVCYVCLDGLVLCVVLWILGVSCVKIYVDVVVMILM